MNDVVHPEDAKKKNPEKVKELLAQVNKQLETLMLERQQLHMEVSTQQRTLSNRQEELEAHQLSNEKLLQQTAMQHLMLERQYTEVDTVVMRAKARAEHCKELIMRCIHSHELMHKLDSPINPFKGWQPSTATTSADAEEDHSAELTSPTPSEDVASPSLHLEPTHRNITTYILTGSFVLVIISLISLSHLGGPIEAMPTADKPNAPEITTTQPVTEIAAPSIAHPPLDALPLSLAASLEDLIVTRIPHGPMIEQANLQEIAMLTTAAQQGNAEAHYQLARAYHAGIIIPRNQEAAARHYQSAAKADHPHAAYHLAALRLQDTSPPSSSESIIPLLKQAAYHKLAEAQYALGVIYANDAQFSYKPDHALAYYWAASQANQAEATIALQQLMQHMQLSMADLQQRLHGPATNPLHTPLPQQ